MPSKTDFNVSPYYDDFSEDKKFHRVMYRPAYAVQARELTTQQSITQNLSFEKAEQWKSEFLENFAMALANVIDILDPDAIVLGGGVSNVSFLYDEGKKAVYEKVFSDLVDTPILENKLGDSAGVFGACLLNNS